MVGNGRDVRFWLDDWMGVGALCRLFLRLFRLEDNKSCPSVIALRKGLVGLCGVCLLRGVFES